MSTYPEVDDHEPKVKCMVHCYTVHSMVHDWVHHIVIDYQQHELEAERSLPNMVGASRVQDSALQLDAAAHAQVAGGP